MVNLCDLSAIADHPLALHTRKHPLFKCRESSKKYDINVYDNVGIKTKIEKEANLLKK